MVAMLQELFNLTLRLDIEFKRRLSSQEKVNISLFSLAKISSSVTFEVFVRLKRGSLEASLN
jgi:hypothetical protein